MGLVRAALPGGAAAAAALAPLGWTTTSSIRAIRRLFRPSKLQRSPVVVEEEEEEEEEEEAKLVRMRCFSS